MAMAVRVGMFGGYMNFDITDVILANIKAKAETIIHDSIDVGDLPEDFWSRWRLLVEKSGSAVLMTVVGK